eukprot:UN12220
MGLFFLLLQYFTTFAPLCIYNNRSSDSSDLLRKCINEFVVKLGLFFFYYLFYSIDVRS